MTPKWITVEEIQIALQKKVISQKKKGKLATNLELN